MLGMIQQSDIDWGPETFVKWCLLITRMYKITPNAKERLKNRMDIKKIVHFDPHQLLVYFMDNYSENIKKRCLN